jgi:hypothetical protein
MRAPCLCLSTRQTAVRKLYVNVAEALGVPVRCFWFDASRELADHLNNYRERVLLSAADVLAVPQSVGLLGSPMCVCLSGRLWSALR